MKKKNAFIDGLTELRLRAEKRWPDTQKNKPLLTSTEEMHKVIHELSIHQIELEMQQDELLQSRAELEDSLERYTELYDFAPLGYLTLARDSTILEVNLTATKMLGVNRSLLKGDRFGRFITVDDLPIFNALLERVFKRSEPKYAEVILLNKNTLLHQNAPSIPRNADIVNRQTVRIDAIVSDDGQDCRAILTDITKEKQVKMENIALQIRLGEAQKLESIGRLAGGVAHDFNNMLQVMLGNLDLLIDSEELKSSVQEIFSDLRMSVLKSAGLTSQLLAFARRQPNKLQVLDFNTVVSNTVSILKHMLGNTIELVYKPADDLLPVMMDGTQIDQIITNLVINAKDAMQGHGILTIQTRNAQLDAEFCEHHPELVPGNYVLFIVQDNGCGMDKTTLDSIFEPFFSTKSRASNTGLGLATVYGIVMQNNGAIIVDSEKGKGTTFAIYLPSYAGKSSPVPVTTRDEKISDGTKIIMLVEDDKSVRDITLEFLKSFGYKVLLAASPTEAISLSNEYSENIHLLVSDVIMPGMNGQELAMILKKNRPGLKILLISGYADDSLVSKEDKESPLPFLGKPFSRRELAQKVNEVLELP
jgi:two-component system cell cycle sensor histidine kinase/response regulator CckA